MTETDADTLTTISAAIIVSGRRVLMVRRRVREGQLMWQFPAGAVDDGESVEQAAVRETWEETGLRVEALNVLGKRVHPKTGRVISYTACSVVGGVPRVADADELDAVAWVAHEEIPDYVPYGLFEPVRRYLDDTLNVAA
jgi:8-oxo-dGTP diphosphatase